MQELLNNTFTQFQAFAGWSTLAEVFIVILCAMILRHVCKRVLRATKVRLEQTENPWDDALILALERPLSMLIWLLGLAFALQILGKKSGAAISAGIPHATALGVIALVSWFVIRLTKNTEGVLVERHAAGEGGWDPTTASAMSKLVRLAVVTTAALVAMQSLGLNISGVLAFGGIGGVAVGFASKDLLSNFFGGLMLYLDRPISVGDWVRSPDRNIEGVVEDIGWRLTRIRTFDKRPLYIPNSIFTSIIVENPSRMSQRRIHETFGLRYDDIAKLDPVIRDVRALLENHPDIDADQTLMVYFNAFGASSVDFFVYCFTKTKDWAEFHRVKHDVLSKINGIVESHDAEFAFPTSTLHLASAPQQVEVPR